MKMMKKEIEIKSFLVFCFVTENNLFYFVIVKNMKRFFSERIMKFGEQNVVNEQETEGKAWSFGENDDENKRN